MTACAPQVPSVLLIGGPDAGKSNYLFRLWLAIDSGAGSLVKNGFPDELEYLRTGLETLYGGNFASRTSKEVLEHITIPVQAAYNRDQAGVLSLPDVPGERILRIYQSREWDSLWEDRIVEGCGCLIFIRAGSKEIVRPLDYAECLKIYGGAINPPRTTDGSTTTADSVQGSSITAIQTTATESKEGDGKDKEQIKPIGPPTDVVLTDWLQFIRRAFTDRVSGSYRPKVGIVIAAWDGVPNDNIGDPPVDYLTTNFPLLRQFVETNDDCFDFEVFGLSILGGDLKNDTEFREAFKKGKPNDFGYDIHSLSGVPQKVHDVTIPVAWALGWLNERSSTEPSV